MKYYGHMVKTKGDNLEKDILVSCVPGNRNMHWPKKRMYKDIEDRLDAT